VSDALPQMPEPYRAGEFMHDALVHSADQLRAYAAAAVLQERERFPNLLPVIHWLERGCDPAEAAKELRVYQQMMSGPKSADKRRAKAAR